MLPLGLLYNGEEESWDQRQYLSAFPDEVYSKQCDALPHLIYKKGYMAIFPFREH